MIPATLRRELKRRRRQLSPDYRAQANARLAARIQQLPAFRRARHIAGYIPCQGEADPLPAMLAAQRQCKQTFLPVLHPFLPRKLIFAPWTATTRFQSNRYNIPEPDMPLWQSIPPARLDLVLTPLLGFDAQANRLGMGGGYYDRTFVFRRYYRYWPRPYLLGVAFSEQQCDELPVNPWDIPLDAVITPDALFLPDSATCT
ncbi:MAG: 5-formyltetrahydrofolate cyclo-ligase [Pseudomonadota bacterium]